MAAPSFKAGGIYWQVSVRGLARTLKQVDALDAKVKSLGQTMGSSGLSRLASGGGRGASIGGDMPGLGGRLTPGDRVAAGLSRGMSGSGGIAGMIKDMPKVIRGMMSGAAIVSLAIVAARVINILASGTLFKSLWSTLGTALSTLVNLISVVLMPIILPAIMALIHFIEGIIKIFSQPGPMFAKIGELIGYGIGAALRAIVTGLLWVVTHIPDIIIGAWQFVIGFVAGILSGLFDNPAIAGFINAIVSFVSGIAHFLGFMATGPLNFLLNIGNTIGKDILSWIGSIGSTIGQDIFNEIVHVGEEIGHAIASHLPGAKQAGAVVSSVENAGSSLWNNTGGRAGQGWHNLTGW